MKRNQQQIEHQGNFEFFLWREHSFMNLLEEYVEKYSYLIDRDFRSLDVGPSGGPCFPTGQTKECERILTQLHKILVDDKSDEGFSQQQRYYTNVIARLQICIRAATVLVRNSENILRISSSGLPGLIISRLSCIFNWLANQENCSWLDKVVDFIHDALYFFECLYDSTFSWRRRFLPRKDHSINTFMLHTPKICHEFVPFYYDVLKSSVSLLDASIIERLNHVLCSAISGSRSNAVNIICPATVDSLVRLLEQEIVDTGTTTRSGPLHSCNLIKNIVICFCFVVENIRTTPPDLRQVDLHGTLVQYFGLLLNKNSKIRLDSAAELLTGICIILKADDKSALQVECCAAGCFKAIIFWAKMVSDISPNDTRWKPDNVQRFLVVLLNCVCDLVCGSEKNEVAFHSSSGYEHLKQALTSHLPVITHEMLKDIFHSILDDIGELLVPRMTCLLISLAGALPEECEQRWILISLQDMANVSSLNLHRMQEVGCSETIVELICLQCRSLSATVINDMFSLLTLLLSHSTSPAQFRTVFSLCQSSDITILSRLCRSLLQAAEDSDLTLPQKWLTLSNSSDAFVLPGVRHWPGPGLTIHMIVRMDKVRDSLYISPDGLRHRQLFCFLTNAFFGYEAFLTSSLSLVVAVITKKDYQTICVKDTPFSDGAWHSVTVAIGSGRRPFGNGHVTVFIDGHQKQTASVNGPSFSEPFPYCRIGCGGSPLMESGQHPLDESVHHSILSLNKSKGRQPFSHVGPAVTSVPAGVQSNIWGISMLLCGKIYCVCLLSEALQQTQVQQLIENGLVPDFSKNAELSSKLMAFYCAEAIQKDMCFDLAPARAMDAYVSSTVCHIRSIKNSLVSAGGLPVLFGLFDVLTEAALQEQQQPSQQKRAQLVPAVDSSAPNTLADVTSLICCCVKQCVQLCDQLTKQNGFPVLQYLLRKAPGFAIDAKLLVAVQAFSDYLKSTGNHRILQQFYKFILFDFSIWSGKTDFTTRIGHIQYLYTLVRDDRKYFRKHFGVSLFLDAVKMYYSQQANERSSVSLSVEDLSSVLNGFVNIIKALILRDISINELQFILQFVFTAPDNDLVLLILRLLLRIANSASGQDQLSLLMFEAGMGELLYSLLLSKHRSSAVKSTAMQIIVCLLGTDKVSDKSKGRLRLQNIGFTGLFHLMKGQHIEADLAVPLTNLVLMPENTSAYQDLVAFLFLLQRSSITTRIEVCRKILTSLFLRPDAVPQFARALCWQEALVKLLIVDTTTDELITSEAVSIASLAVAETLSQENISSVSSQVQLAPADAAAGVDQFAVAASNVDDIFNNSSTSTGADTTSFSLEVSHILDAGALDSSFVGDLQSFRRSWDGGGESLKSESALDFAEEVGPSPVLRPLVHRSKSRASTGTVVEELAYSPPEYRGIEEDSFVSSTHLLRPASVSGHVPPLRCSTTSSFYTLPSHTHSFAESLRSTIADQASFSAVPGNFDVKAAATPVDDRRISESRRSRNEFECSSGSDSSFNPPTPPPPRIFAEDEVTVEQYLERRQEDAGTGAIIRSSFNKQHSSDDVASGLLSFPAVADKKSSSEDDELLLLVLNVAFTTMWLGYPKDEKEVVWRSRGLLFGALNMTGCSHYFVSSHAVAYRQLLETSVHTAYMDAKQQAQAPALVRENAFEVMKWVYDFYHSSSIEQELEGRYSKRLLEGVDNLFKLCSLSRTASDNDSLVFFVFSTLAAYLQQTQSIELSALAAAITNDILQKHQQHCFSLEIAAFLLSKIEQVFSSSLASSNYTQYLFVAPVVKSLLSLYPSEWEVHRCLPSFSAADGGCFQTQSMNAEEFCRYLRTEEYKEFVRKKVLPLGDRYRSRYAVKWKNDINQLWNECYEQIMVASHRRNLVVGESQLSFQSQILDTLRRVVAQENRRYGQMLAERRVSHRICAARWEDVLLELQNERGILRSEKEIQQQRHWKLSSACENFSRMRLKLEINRAFDDHMDASRARDNSGGGADQWSAEASITCIKAPPHRQSCAADDEDALAIEETLKTLRKMESGEKKLTSNAAESGESKDATPVISKEKIRTILTEPCRLVTVTDVVDGRLELTEQTIYFWDNNAVKDLLGGNSFEVPLLELREVHLRRYNLRRSALEFFLIDQSNFFLNFSAERRNKIYSKIIATRPPNLIYGDARTPAEMLKASGMTQKWINHEISNFDYLMHLNTVAGRTYNDLSQYPVFPWILSDYYSDTLNLNDPAVFRDLSKPIGVINPAHEEEVRQKYESFEDVSGIPKFHYGTHYSNAAGVIHYLIRMEPFSTLHVHLQSGKFDVPDRLFHSVARTWKTLMDSPNDSRELIPEFFYCPDFLVNSNRFDLGQLAFGTRERVDDVMLPAWATSPEDFVEKHRKALESPLVSAQLNNWIDLIFGYKQKGEAAAEALNVFYYCSYEGAVDLDSIADPAERLALEGVINNFGQTPCQLLKELHPKRLTFEEVSKKALQLESAFVNLFTYISQCRTFSLQVYDEKESIKFIDVPRSQTKAAAFIMQQLQQNAMQTLLTVSGTGLVGAHDWLPHNRRGKCNFTFERDATLSSNLKSAKRVVLGVHRFVSNQQFALSHDGRLLFVAGYWDNSFRIFNTTKLISAAPPIVVRRHSDMVTCAALDTVGTYLITGSADCTCMVWRILYQGGNSKDIDRVPTQILCGHYTTVTCATLRSELDLAASGSEDGSILLHTIKTGSLLHCLRSVVSPSSKSASVLRLATSYQGKVVACVEEKLTNHESRCYVHVFSVNGKSLARESVPSDPISLHVDSDFVVTAHQNGLVSLRGLSKLDTILTMPLRVQLCCSTIVPTSSHILCGSKDGRIFVLCADRFSSQ